jgi:ATP-dependent protease ClpP protease subunit/FtsZ-binding cell division protein ZapB
MAKIGIVNIIGSIGAYEDVSLKSVMQQIQSVGNVDEYLLVINSGGGEVMEGFAIYNHLLSLNKPITTRGSGIVGSIATLIFLAGKKRQLYPNTQFLIHNPFTFAEGDASDLMKRAEELKNIENHLLEVYISKTGAERETLSNLMNADTLITSDSAFELKFATEILNPIVAFAKINLNNKNKNQMSKIGKIFKNAFAELKKAGVILNDVVLTQDGQELEIEMMGSELSVGDSVKSLGEAVDGTYTLADGTIIEVAGGLVTSVTAPMNASVEVEVLNKKKSELEVEIANLNEQLAKLSAENETLKNENVSMTEEVEVIVNHLKKLNIKASLPTDRTFTSKNVSTDVEQSKDEIKARFKELAEKSKKKTTLAI